MFRSIFQIFLISRDLSGTAVKSVECTGEKMSQLRKRMPLLYAYSSLQRKIEGLDAILNVSLCIILLVPLSFLIFVFFLFTLLF